MHGKLVIISGPSGAGKGTLVKELLARVPGLSLSVSATTRAPRPDEVDGVDYHFLTPGEFDSRVDAGELLEWAEVHGNRYGTLRRAVEEDLAEGKTVVLEIDPQGAFQVRERMPGAMLVFIVAPSREELARRIRERGAETEDQVAARLKTAERELALVGTYDYVIMNDDVRRAVHRLEEIVRSP